MLLPDPFLILLICLLAHLCAPVDRCTWHLPCGPASASPFVVITDRPFLPFFFALPFSLWYLAVPFAFLLKLALFVVLLNLLGEFPVMGFTEAEMVCRGVVAQCMADGLQAAGFSSGKSRNPLPPPSSAHHHPYNQGSSPC
eukprot:RCo037500